MMIHVQTKVRWPGSKSKMWSNLRIKHKQTVSSKTCYNNLAALQQKEARSTNPSCQSPHDGKVQAHNVNKLAEEDTSRILKMLLE